MYAQVEKPKENKSRAIAHSAAQKKSSVKQGFGFVDNRPETISQRKLQETTGNSILQKQIGIQKRENGNRKQAIQKVQIAAATIDCPGHGDVMHLGTGSKIGTGTDKNT